MNCSTRPIRHGLLQTYLITSTKPLSKWTVQVEPKFHDDASNLEQLVPFEECIELHSSGKEFVKAPEYLLLTHNGRSFNIVVDPTKLSDGSHYYELCGIDCKAPWCGPVFRIPVTITKAMAVKNRPALLSFSGMSFLPDYRLITHTEKLQISEYFCQSNLKTRKSYCSARKTLLHDLLTFSAMSGLLNLSLNGSASNLPDSTGRSFATSFSAQSGAASPLFHHTGTIQGLHNLHGSFNVPNMPGTLASRNSTINNVPSSGVQQPTGSLSSGRFASNNLPVALSQISHGSSHGLSGVTNRGGMSVG